MIRCWKSPVSYTAWSWRNEADRAESRGRSLLAGAREAATQHRSVAVFVPLIDIELGREKVANR